MKGFYFRVRLLPAGTRSKLTFVVAAVQYLRVSPGAAPYKLGGTLHERSTVAYFIVTIMLTGSCKSYEDVKSASDIRIRIDQNNGYAQ